MPSSLSSNPALGHLLLAGWLFSACAGSSPHAAAPQADGATAESTEAVTHVLDDWHKAAAVADEARYFSHLAPNAIFLGTDATERWDVSAFRAFAHPYFAKGKAWSFRAVRRDVLFSEDGTIAWFDEDLDTPNMGPVRGSGVLVRTGEGAWKIVHYNLAITVPNDRMKAVKSLIAGEAAPAP